MKKLQNVYFALIASVIMGAAIASAADHHDPVLASFDRLLDHQPAPVTPTTNAAIEKDVLYQMINRALWTRTEPDPVLASFRRAFDYRGPVAPVAKSVLDKRDIRHKRISEPLQLEVQGAGETRILSTSSKN